MVTAAPNTVLTPGPGTGPARPAVPVPVAFCGRTSTLEMQDPVASMRRQLRTAETSLPPGFQITAWYWDIESGALDLADRSQGDAWRQVAEQVGIPRDGGVADLLAEACGPAPRFAVVVCEEIERVARDTLASLTLEKELAKRGIAIFAADEPASVEGAGPTTILVRRVRQGVADYFRLQMLNRCRNGLIQHALDGWNIGAACYRYLPERHQHPAGIKAAQGRTRTRLVPDPERGPVTTQIFDWRVARRLSVPTIAWKLNADPAAYPPPGGANGWTESSVSAILRNPKYTGYMVYGRTRKDPATKKSRPVPPDQWIWSPEPTHTPLTSLATWQAAQGIGAERGNVRDSEKPTIQPGSRYMLRSRIRHQACQRRMYGTRRPTSAKATPGAEYTYYHCPYNPSNPGTSPPTPATARTQSPSAKKPSWPPSPRSWTSGSSAATAPPCSPASSPPPPPSTSPPAPARKPTCAANWTASTPPPPG